MLDFMNYINDYINKPLVRTIWGQSQQVADTEKDNVVNNALQVAKETCSPVVDKIFTSLVNNAPQSTVAKIEANKDALKEFINTYTESSNFISSELGEKLHDVVELAQKEVQEAAQAAAQAAKQALAQEAAQALKEAIAQETMKKTAQEAAQAAEAALIDKLFYTAQESAPTLVRQKEEVKGLINTYMQSPDFISGQLGNKLSEVAKHAKNVLPTPVCELDKAKDLFLQCDADSTKDFLNNTAKEIAEESSFDWSSLANPSLIAAAIAGLVSLYFMSKLSKRVYEKCFDTLGEAMANQLREWIGNDKGALQLVESMKPAALKLFKKANKEEFLEFIKQVNSEVGKANLFMQKNASEQKSDIEGFQFERAQQLAKAKAEVAARSVQPEVSTATPPVPTATPVSTAAPVTTTQTPVTVANNARANNIKVLLDRVKGDNKGTQRLTLALDNTAEAEIGALVKMTPAEFEILMKTFKDLQKQPVKDKKGKVIGTERTKLEAWLRMTPAEKLKVIEWAKDKSKNPSPSSYTPLKEAQQQQQQAQKVQPAAAVTPEMKKVTTLKV